MCCARLSGTWASIKAPTEGRHVRLIKELPISRDWGHLSRIMDSRLLANANPGSKSILGWEKAQYSVRLTSVRACVRSPRNHIKKPGVVEDVCNPNSGKVETSGSLGLAGHQFTLRSKLQTKRNLSSFFHRVSESQAD